MLKLSVIPESERRPFSIDHREYLKKVEDEISKMNLIDFLNSSP